MVKASRDERLRVEAIKEQYKLRGYVNGYRRCSCGSTAIVAGDDKDCVTCKAWGPRWKDQIPWDEW